MRDPYALVVPSYSPYGKRTEPDMRQELNNMFDGVFPEIAKSHPVLLRKMRREPDGKLTKCVCVDKNTQEPDRDIFCPFCHGEGSYWDEMWVDTYSVDIAAGGVQGALADRMIAPGLMNEPIVVFYFRSHIDITLEDRIVEVVLDSEGRPSRPYRRKKLYRLGDLVDFRSDNGKLEYWRASGYSEKRKFLNGMDR